MKTINVAQGMHEAIGIIQETVKEQAEVTIHFYLNRDPMLGPTPDQVSLRRLNEEGSQCFGGRDLNEALRAVATKLP